MNKGCPKGIPFFSKKNDFKRYTLCLKRKILYLLIPIFNVILQQ